MWISRFFQFAVVAYYLLALLEVACRHDPDSPNHAMNKERTNYQPVLRRHFLYHGFSMKFLQIRGKNVIIDKEKSFAELLFRGVGSNSTIQIQGAKSKTYLCFNKKGRLMARYRFVPEFCVFEEKIMNSYTELWLRRRNKSIWKVGFSKTRKPVHGDYYKHDSSNIRCFQFLKTNTTENNMTSLSPFNAEADNDAVGMSSSSGIRHSRQHKKNERQHRLRHSRDVTKNDVASRR